MAIGDGHRIPGPRLLFLSQIYNSSCVFRRADDVRSKHRQFTHNYNNIHCLSNHMFYLRLTKNNGLLGNAFATLAVRIGIYQTSAEVDFR